VAASATICGGILIVLLRFLVVGNAIGLGWAYLIGIYASFGTLFLCYQMWRVIGDGQTRVSPIKAVTGLFVPVFGIFWLFRVFPGFFVSEFNAYVRRHHLSAAEL
jgi:hypothetical protein